MVKDSLLPILSHTGGLSEQESALTDAHVPPAPTTPQHRGSPTYPAVNPFATVPDSITGSNVKGPAKMAPHSPPSSDYGSVVDINPIDPNVSSNPTHLTHFQMPPFSRDDPPPSVVDAGSHVGGGAHDALGPEAHEGLLDDASSGEGSLAEHFLNFSADSVPKERRIANIGSLPFGAMLSPVKDVSPGPPVVRTPPIACENCGAIHNLYSQKVYTETNAVAWRCAFCLHEDEEAGHGLYWSGSDYSQRPELTSEVVDYLDAGSPHPVYSSASDAAMSAPVFFLLDESVDPLELQHLQASLHATLSAVPPATRVGVLTYGKSVSVYDLSHTGVASADVIPGDQAPSSAALHSLLFGSGVHLAPLHACLPILQDVITALRPYRGTTPEVERKRSLGVAVEVALALIRGPASDAVRSSSRGQPGGSGRILVCAAGPVTHGPGSIPSHASHPSFAYELQKARAHMAGLAAQAKQLEVAIDMLCAGTCPVHVPVLHPLAQGSGGVLLLLADGFEATFAENVRRAILRGSGSRGSLSVRCSPPLQVARVIGPAETLAEVPQAVGPNDAASWFHLCTVERQQGLALYLQLAQDTQQQWAYCQVAVHYTSTQQTSLVRVITARLPTTGSLSTYLRGVDCHVAAALIAKKTVLEARSMRDAVELREQVDNRVRDMALKLGRATETPPVRRFPPEMDRLPELLFHLRRGPLLGSILQHEDERAVLRHTFLQASLAQSVRMVVPQLLAHHTGGTFEELPPASLALQSDQVLLLDHGTDIFIWRGSDTAWERQEAAVAACHSLAAELSEHRFPAPRILAFAEGSSPARYLQARLIPAHKDAPYEQEARFPQLKQLSAEARAKLRQKLIATDDLSFCEWMRKLQVVPTESRGRQELT